MWAILRDISERKAVLKAMQQSEARFRMIFESSPDPLIIARIDGGGILAVNRSFVLNTGIPAEEAQGRNGLELNLWADLNERDEFLRVLSEDGEVVNLDLANYADCEAAVKDVDAVVHMAIAGGQREEYKTPELPMKWSVVATTNLLEASHRAGIKRFVLMSSGAVVTAYPAEETGRGDA